MKEHRTKALRVTTPHSIENGGGANNKDDYCARENGNDLFGTLQILQFELVPSRSNSPPLPSPSQSSSSMQLNVSSSSDTFYMQSSSNRRSHSEMMTTHTATATFTANPAFGKQDSFYRWFSSEFKGSDDNNDNDEHDNNDDDKDVKEEEDEDEDEEDDDDNDEDEGDSERVCHYARKPCELFCGKCEKNLQQTWKTCHCRTTFDERKVKQNRSVLSVCSIRHHSTSTCFSFFHSGHCCSILDLVSGNLSDNWFLKIRDIKEAISREKNCCPKYQWYKVRDANGNTALLVSGQKLLKEGCFDGAVELAKILLEEGSDVNVINNENRTLLSYSIQYMDKSIRLTTLLINYGANVWPMSVKVELPVSSSSSSNRSRRSSSNSSSSSSGGEKYANGSNCNSAFTWFLRSIIRQLKLSEHCLQTLYLLAEVMGEKPNLMRSHVMSTMFSHAKCYSILGPVFLQIKLAMSPYWAQPQSLKFLCKSVIRKSIISVPGRFINTERMSSLMLPPSLQSYLMLEY